MSTETSPRDTELQHESTFEFLRAFSWSVIPIAIAIAAYSSPVQRWLDVQPPAFPGDAFVSPALGSALLVASGPFLRGAVSEARERRPGPILLVGLAMTVGVLALVASLFFTGCGC